MRWVVPTMLALAVVVANDEVVAQERRRALEEAPCVRRDGDFGRHYNDQFTGFVEVSDSQCELSTGPYGTNYLYARGGLGNQLHCMAALQRIDPTWRAFDNTRRAYLSEEFHSTRVSEMPENVHEIKLMHEQGVHPFPVCNALIQSRTPCNCWHVIALRGDACGELEQKGADDSATLRARTAKAFAELPIKPDLKKEAQRFVDKIVATSSSIRRRPLVGVHTRTGSLSVIDGIAQAQTRGDRTTIPVRAPRFNRPQRGGGGGGPTKKNRRLDFLNVTEKKKIDDDARSRRLKVPSLSTTSFNTSRLLRAICEEIRDLVAKHAILPAVLIASDNLRVSHWLSRRILESSEDVLDAAATSSNATQAHAIQLALEYTPTLNVVTAHEAKVPFYTSLENDMIELLALSHADVLVKDNTLRESTYSEAAWWLGGATAKRVHVPFPQRDLLPDCLKEGTDYS